MRDVEGGRWVRDGLAVLAPVLVVFVLPALQLSRRNLEVLGLQASMFRWLAVGAVVLLMLGTALARLRHRHRAIELAFLFYLALAPFCLLYIAAGSWVTRDVAAIAAIVLTFAAVVSVFPRRSAREAVLLGTSIFGVGLLVLALIEANTLRSTNKRLKNRERRTAQREAPLFTGSARDESRPDVYHVVFDEFQTDYFELATRPEQRAALGGFVFFPDATTPWGRTDMALGATFSGEPYLYEGEPIDYILRAFLGDRSLLSRLGDHGYHTTGLLHQVYPTVSTTPLDRTLQHIRYGDFGGSTDQAQLFTALWMEGNLPESIVERLVPPNRLDMLRAQTLLPASYGYYSVLSLRRYLADESTWASNAPRYVFIHMIVPHEPIALDEDCSESESEDLTIEGQARCAVNLLIELVETLKREGRFDDSLIIAHGDHGSRYARHGRTLVPIGSETRQDWQEARSRPLLLVKPAGGNASMPLCEDPRPADLYDIYPTILAAAGLERGKFAIGSSLTQAAPADRSRDYHFYKKDPDDDRLIDGDIAHYRVTSDGLIFDRNIPIRR